MCRSVGYQLSASWQTVALTQQSDDIYVDTQGGKNRSDANLLCIWLWGVLSLLVGFELSAP